MADRSVSFPMTLNDLERREARRQIFRQILIMLVPFDLEPLWGEALFPGSATFLPHVGAAALPNF